MADSPVPYKGAADGTGGDSLHEDLNIYYSVSPPWQHSKSGNKITNSP